ncbi:HpcH/HpaI aldolase/citrate lyase family protein [Mycolicibacterium sp.]|uniref:HpcH/HpaI aldolase/citrate lyase family protein n=1 Tax=Mycolicibacterium sp. TaxID=2320850 RepID=UPI003D0F6075
MKPVRSLLFAPGDRPDLIGKAAASGADAIIVDLEDAVAVDRKPEARTIVRDTELPTGVEVLVRVNAEDTGLLYDDLAVAIRPGVAGIVVPKAESAASMTRLDGAVTALEAARGLAPGSVDLVPLVESALGVRNAYDVLTAADRVRAVLFGSGEQGDLVADLDCEWTPEGTALLHARSQVLLAARAAGLSEPLDAVFMDFRNDDALRVECELARRLGYVGKCAIHPRQVPVIHEVFTPDADVVAGQERILKAFEEAEAQGLASISVDGRMVDYAVARRARAILARTPR